MQKIGIMGGTFNPVHNAHLMLAEHAIMKFSLDSVIFLPSGRPPHKLSSQIVLPEHRYGMLHAALQGRKNFLLSDYELRKNCITYTADTVRELHDLYPKDKFYFIIGGDSLMEFEHWYHPEQIIRYVTILASGRSGQDNLAIQLQLQKLNDLYNGTFLFFETPSSDLSSYIIREMLHKGASIHGMVPEPVEEYILMNNLYH
jgi:nicotinate-nucleotide adenylyltransferase